MNRLTLFIVLLFVIGLILVITTFTAYSKITESCKSKKLRSYLRWCVGVGSVLLTIAIMYFVCTKREGCKCDFNIDAGWKIYLTLFILVAMGGFLVYLVTGIQREIKTDGCDIDLGSLPGVLWVISIAQIVLPLIYSGIVLYTGKNGSSRSKDDDEGDEGDEYYEGENESENIERLAHKSIELEKDISSLDKHLTKYTTELSALKREKVKKKDLDARRKKIKIVSSKISGLENRLKTAKSTHSSIESQLSSGSVSSSNSSGGFSSGFGGGLEGSV